MELEHINLKFFTDAPAFDQEALIKVFHDWIREKSLDGFLIDVADYRHVPNGPGVMLIALEAQYNMDEADGQLGLRYNRKTPLEGDNRSRLKDAFKKTIGVCQLLEKAFPAEDGLKFNRSGFQLMINDRGVAPNTAEAFEELKGEVDGFLSEVADGHAFTLNPTDDPRRLLTVNATSSSELDFDAVVSKC